MLKLEDIHELIKLIDESGLDEFEYEQEGTKLVLKKNQPIVNQQTVAAPSYQEKAFVSPSAQAPSETPQVQTEGNAMEENKQTEDSNLHKIESPMVGTFYASPSPEEGVYVNVGDQVTADSVVCIVEAMKLFNEIDAEVNGEIVEILVENGQLVEYGQPLFLVKPQ